MKKDKYYLFTNIIRSKYLNYIIFTYVHEINTQLFNINYNKQYRIRNNKNDKYKWDRLILTPSAMVGNNYFKQLDSFYKDLTLDNLLKDINQTTRAMIMAVINGNLSILKYIVEEIILKRITSKEIVCKFFFDTSNVDLMYLAAFNRTSVDPIFEYLDDLHIRKVVAWNYYDAMTVVPFKGDFRLLKWFSERTSYKALLANGPSYQTSVIEVATQKGRVDMVEWLIENRPSEPVDDLMRRAVIGGHTDMVEWLVSNYIPYEGREHLMDIAAGTSNLDLLNWMNDHNIKKKETSYITFTSSRFAMDQAEMNGNTSVSNG